jgi:hypothetical protein
MPKAKEKRNWKHIHKIRVHENRWLVWTLAIAVLVCASLVAYIQVSDINFLTQVTSEYSSVANWSSFTHKAEGYSVKYPRTWGVEAETGGSISFISSNNPNEYFTVTPYPLGDERTLRTALFSTDEESVTVNGVSGLRLNESRNQLETIVMLKDSSKVYVLRGKGNSFDRILSTFRLAEKLERI